MKKPSKPTSKAASTTAKNAAAKKTAAKKTIAKKTSAKKIAGKKAATKSVRPPVPRKPIGEPFHTAESPNARGSHTTAGREEIREITHRVMGSRQSQRPIERHDQARKKR
jgi:hypothetical protein